MVPAFVLPGKVMNHIIKMPAETRLMLLALLPVSQGAGRRKYSTGSCYRISGMHHPGKQAHHNASSQIMLQP